MPLPRALARLNRAATNHLMRPLAGHLPGLGVVEHEGRKSGRIYETPVTIFRRPGGFAVALPYGQGDWVKNVLAAGTAKVRTHNGVHVLVDPVVVADPDHKGVPAPARALLRLTGADEVLQAAESDV